MSERDRPAKGIEITEAMIDAGTEVLSLYSQAEDSWDTIVMQVFLAMIAAMEEE